MDVPCSMKNMGDIDYTENTFKQYYFPLSDEEDTALPPYQNQRNRSEDSASLDEFFEEPKKKKSKRSSTVGKPNKESTAYSYVSTNTDDESNASHLIKIEVYDLKKLKTIEKDEHWKHADVRVKYYTKKEHDELHKQARGLIYHITKEISNAPDCKKYSFKKQ